MFFHVFEFVRFVFMFCFHFMFSECRWLLPMLGDVTWYWFNCVDVFVCYVWIAVRLVALPWMSFLFLWSDVSRNDCFDLSLYAFLSFLRLSLKSWSFISFVDFFYVLWPIGFNACRCSLMFGYLHLFETAVNSVCKCCIIFKCCYLCRLPLPLGNVVSHFREVCLFWKCPVYPKNRTHSERGPPHGGPCVFA